MASTMIKRVMRTNYLLPPLDMSTRQALYEAGDRSIDSDANFCSCMHTYKLVRSHSYPFFLFVTSTYRSFYLACLQGMDANLARHGRPPPASSCYSQRRPVVGRRRTPEWAPLVPPATPRCRHGLNIFWIDYLCIIILLL